MPLRRREERRFAAALVGSSALHLALLLSLPQFGLWASSAAPASDAPVPLTAILQPATPEAPAVDLVVPPIARLDELDVPDFSPAPATSPPSSPTARPAAAAEPAARADPGEATRIVRNRPIAPTTDPNGRISYSTRKDRGALGVLIGAQLAARYPVTPYRLPDLEGSLSLTYPAAAQEAHRNGRVAAVLDLDANGAIIKVTLVPEDSVFGPAVLAALKEARFAPAATTEGRIPYWLILEFAFAIAPGPSSSAGAPAVDSASLASGASIATSAIAAAPAAGASN